MTYIRTRSFVNIVHHCRRLAFDGTGNFQQHFPDYFNLSILGSNVKGGQAGLQSNAKKIGSS